ncbi:MAG: recombinase family protein [Lachnospiraceae bacterium]|nr:recombinase family protein [Lachnospiraceae bacterium]
MQTYLDKTYHAAIYLRLSREDGDFTGLGEKKESNSIANQRKLIEDFLKNHPEIISYQEFCDDGYTGTNFDRPDFQRMLDQIKKREINCIVVKDLSRFGRDYIDSGKYIEKIFPALGVRFIAINDNYDSAMTQQAGNEIILPFKNLINDSYSRDISIKVRSNLEIKRRNGEYVGTHVMYGYRRSEENKNQLVIDPDAAPVVQTIFRMKIDGYSPAQIANKLNVDGIPSPAEYKRLCGDKYRSAFQKSVHPLWSAMTIYRILKNEVYTSTLVQGKSSSPNYKVKTRTQKDPSEWVRVEDTHEAIISAANFDLVQRLMLDDTRSPSGKQGVHLFSGKVFCGDCHASMVRKAKKSCGRDYIYLMCSAHQKDSHFCFTHAIREQTVYDAVLAVIQAQVSLALDLEKALKKLDGVSWERRELQQIQRKIVRQEEIIDYNMKMKLNIYEDFKMEVITMEEYKMFKEDCDKKIQEAKNAISRLQGNRNLVKSGLTEQQSWLSQFKEYKNIKTLTRRVIVHFVDRIEISADKEVHVTLNNADQFQAITEFLDIYQKNPAAEKASGKETKEVR